MNAWEVMVVVVVALMAVIGVAAAFVDRRRARQISHDLGGRLDQRRQGRRRRDG